MSMEHKAVVRGIVDKLPPPDALDMDVEEEGKDEGEEGDDEEAKSMAKKSAFKDFVVALGLNPKKADAAMDALEDFLSQRE